MNRSIVYSIVFAVSIMGTSVYSVTELQPDTAQVVQTASNPVSYVKSKLTPNRIMLLRTVFPYLLSAGFSLAFIIWIMNKSIQSDVYGKVLFNGINEALEGRKIGILKRLYIFYLLKVKVPVKTIFGVIPTQSIAESNLNPLQFFPSY